MRIACHWSTNTTLRQIRHMLKWYDSIIDFLSSRKQMTTNSKLVNIHFIFLHFSNNHLYYDFNEIFLWYAKFFCVKNIIKSLWSIMIWQTRYWNCFEYLQCNKKVAIFKLILCNLSLSNLICRMQSYAFRLMYKWKLHMQIYFTMLNLIIL